VGHEIKYTEYFIFKLIEKKNNDHHDTSGNISVGYEKMGFAVIAPNENIFTLFFPISELWL
jgi:hypothetical protein